MGRDQRDLGAVRMAVRREQRPEQRLVDVQQLLRGRGRRADLLQPTCRRPASLISSACTS